MTILALEADTELYDSQVPDSGEYSSVEESDALIYNEPENELSDESEAVTETISSASVSYPDYSEQLELIEADTRVILYVLLLFVVILFLWLTYKLYNTIMN